MANKITSVLFLGVLYLLLSLLYPKNLYATPEGQVNCGTTYGPGGCQCDYTVDCGAGGECDCTCGENCPIGPGPGPGPGSNVCDGCGTFQEGDVWITSVQSYDTSFVVNWDGDWGKLDLPCVTRRAYDFMVYIGTSYFAVNNNCQILDSRYGNGIHPAIGNFRYRGVGSALPYGCSYSRYIPDQNTRSFNSASAGITLSPGTTYYIKVAVSIFWKPLSNPDEPIFGLCGGSNSSAHLSACTVSPSSAQVAVGSPPVSFTTNAFRSANVAIPNPVPTISAVEFVPFGCAEEDNQGNCKRYITESFTIRGYNLGKRGIAGIADHIKSDSPYIRIKRHGSTQVLYDGPSDAYPDEALYTNYGEIRYEGRASNSPNIPSWMVPIFPHLPRLTPEDITVYYPPPASNTVSNKIDRVEYSQSNAPPQNISINPATATSVSNNYLTSVTGILPRSTLAQLMAKVFVRRGTTTVQATQCTAGVTVTQAQSTNPWWQVKDSDVQANGALRSRVPSSSYFGLPGAGGFPGVPAHKDGTNGTITTTNASQTYGWLAQSSWLNSKVFGYDFFVNLIPSDEIDIKNIVSESELTGATPDADGFEWYRYNGGENGRIPFNITQPKTLGSRKVILLVDSANLNINSSINGITKGAGFFMAIVKGNITVKKSVTGSPSIEGLYVADGSFSTTDAPGAEDDSQLHVRGSVAAYGGVNLDRNMGTNNSSPAELFEYAPDLIRLYPPTLGNRKIKWKEVAP